METLGGGLGCLQPFDLPRPRRALRGFAERHPRSNLSCSEMPESIKGGLGRSAGDVRKTNGCGEGGWWWQEPSRGWGRAACGPWPKERV